MKTLDYVIFWAVCSIVCVPVIISLMSDDLVAVFGVLYAAVWWIIFNKTRFGRKAFKKGSQIASDIMGDCDM